MQFRIPQFLDIEDKVIGPFTFKQFLYLLGSGAFAYIFWKIIPSKIIAVPFIMLFSGTFLALAFVKIHTRPFADVLESAYKFLLGNKVFLWQKEEKREDFDSVEALRSRALLKKEEPLNEKKVTLEKLKELSSRLDILSEENKVKDLRSEIFKNSGKYQI